MNKILIASDIHGSAYWSEKLLDVFRFQGASRLLLLGDLLYHGPRNDLPQDYAPKKVFASLNAIKDKITAVRGNCDSEVDQMVLAFPMLADYAIVSEGSWNLFATHGHLFNEATPPLLNGGDVLLNGHFHKPCHKKLSSGTYYVNCGSVSLPFDATPHSCVIVENGTFRWLNIESGQVFDELVL